MSMQDSLGKLVGFPDGVRPHLSMIYILVFVCSVVLCWSCATTPMESATTPMEKKQCWDDFQCGANSFLEGQYVLSYVYLSRHLESNPSCFMCFVIMGHIKEILGDYHGALMFYRQAEAVELNVTTDSLLRSVCLKHYPDETCDWYINRSLFRLPWGMAEGQ